MEPFRVVYNTERLFFLRFRPGFATCKTVLPHQSKKHMAYRKKYKPCILKYKALVSKYMPYIFCEKRYLIFSNLQNPQKEGQFRGV